MGIESCNIPDNTFSGLDEIILPSELTDSIVQGTEGELVNCFIESLDMDSPSQYIINIAKEVIRVLGERGDYARIEFNEEFIHRLIRGILDLLKKTQIREYIYLFKNSSQSFVLINGVSINFNDYMDVQDISLENVRTLYSEGLLSRDESWEILEGTAGFQEDKNMIIDSETSNERGYNLSDALSEFGFSENFLASMREITGREMNNFEQERLLLMLRFFLQIESRGGYNIEHDTGATSAEGYLQYVHQNGRLRIDRNEGNKVIGYEWLTNSFETGLRKIPDSLLARYEGLSSASAQSGIYLRRREGETIENFEARILQNQNTQSPISLSSDEQLILTLNDLFSRNSTGEYFDSVFKGTLEEAQRAIIHLYVWEHHKGILTSAGLDDATKRLITETAINQFGYSEQVVLFSPVPPLRPENLTKNIEGSGN